MEQVLLVLRGTPATVDDERDAAVRRSAAQGTKEIWVELGYTRDRVIEDRRAGGDGTAGLAKRRMVLVAWDRDRRPGR